MGFFVIFLVITKLSNIEIYLVIMRKVKNIERVLQRRELISIQFYKITNDTLNLDINMVLNMAFYFHSCINFNIKYQSGQI